MFKFIRSFFDSGTLTLFWVMQSVFRGQLTREAIWLLTDDKR